MVNQENIAVNNLQMSEPPRKRLKNVDEKTIDYRYGNYRNYYFKRLGSGDHLTDIRLNLLEAHPEYFRNKQVLDIGCNSGVFSINFAKSLQPKSLLGIDIDGALIDMARKNLQKERTDLCLTEGETEALSRVLFRKANYILSDRTLLDYEKPNYDAILCLSVTKWIHLNYGDEGIKFLFKRIFKQLNENGVLILESQPFGGYKKRSKLNAEILQNYKSITLKPEQFEAYLLSDEIGFSESWCMTDREILEQSNLPKGFHRPLQVFVKR